MLFSSLEFVLFSFP